MKESNIVLELKDVSKHYSEGGSLVKALDNVSLKVNRGDFTVIIGPSGSGKSTLLHMVGLLDDPSSGEIYLDGIKTAKMSENEKAGIRNGKIGFVFQTFNLIPSLNALENVEIAQIIKGIDKDKRNKAGNEVLEKLGMVSRAHHLPNQLSGGEKQRIAIARALINDPDLILADEPTGNLDTKRGEEIIEIFKKLNKEGKTIVIITHDLNIAKKAKKIIRLRDGKIIK